MSLLLGKRGTTKSKIFDEYVEYVANKSLMPYKTILQYGGKEGQSLYAHVMDGVQVLETLREPLELTDVETRVLFTAFTVHDLNKVPGQPQNVSFSKVATSENILAEIERLNLAAFFPDWQTYLEDITTLIRGHGGHSSVAGEALIVKNQNRYELGLDQVMALIYLIRAIDAIDLSHTLTEQAHKDTFLSHLNTYLSERGIFRQYKRFTHQLTEQRGLLSNLVHNSIAGYLQKTYKLIPTLFYPSGIVYLGERGQIPTITAADIEAIATQVAQSVSRLTGANFADFIDSTTSGIKVDAKCLELGIPFSDILNEIENHVQRRNLDATTIEAKARDRAQQSFEKVAVQHPKMAGVMQAALTDDTPLIPTNPDRLRIAELVRSYYIFLNKHFDKTIKHGWEHIYNLLDLPAEQHAFYAYFSALWDRAYVVAADLTLTWDEVYQRIETDGTALTTGDRAEDPKTALFTQYLDLYALFSQQDKPIAAVSGQYIKQYVTRQHKQCVQCSGPFPTDKWMTGDVRSDITVQAFSNRLRGGSGEPKKYICAVCQIQFMLEKLNYTEVRGEKTLYLHLYPYAFLTAPFIQALQATIRTITTEDTAVQALNLNVQSSMQAYLNEQTILPTFRSRTKANKPQPYGLYLPRYSETVSNVPIFPINPSGSNDTEQFLFVLWNALLLQRSFGIKVILSNAAIPPLDAEHTPDLYIDNIPLACQGLLPRNDFHQYVNNNKDGPLKYLWDDVAHLFKLDKMLAVPDSHLPQLVRALGGHPLTIFYETERLIEARGRGADAGGLLNWLYQQALEHVEGLALNRHRGDNLKMTQLSNELRRLAELAWKNGLRGRTLKRSSLLFPVDEVLTKMRQMSEVMDADTAQAAAAQDIFDHIDRIVDYDAGKKKKLSEASQAFVAGWFDEVLANVYGNNLRRLLNDEKLIRSAYQFYIRDQISGKKELTTEAEPVETQST